ncbi:hypothetical protein DPEC_G00325400 [Dallia pectoralis]|uniref:Uncharacterized protein n=1 Tax=Dallia pectoralis TaxID=75939 RepID=A0ACC2F7K3_DALPE|nr:hypothetical protein DPEC_G00325400 [Dallia pectoralis]
MSEDIGRKVQPFTIGTILAPGRFKCPGLRLQSSWQSGSEGKITLQSSLHDRLSLYPSHAQVCGGTPGLAHLSRASPAKQTPTTCVPFRQHQLEDTAALPPLGVFQAFITTSRSIKKINISSSPEKEHITWRKQEPSDDRVISVGPVLRPGTEDNNNNNNNNKPGLARILGVYKPSLHIKSHQGQGTSPHPQFQFAAIPQPHPPLQTQRCPQVGQHYQTQLQKFTVSADKTLSWLKDNVTMATQVCSLIGSEAKRLQDVLEQELIMNRDKIEVVKQEGRELIRNQNPSSSKIQEFLTRLNDLWEELKRRHHRNHIYLQSKEEMNYKVMKELQHLGIIEAWLHALEMSLWNSQVVSDPDTMRQAEIESCLLQKELSVQGLELATLRQEVDRLESHRSSEGLGYPRTGDLQVPHIHLLERMEQVERKYQSVQTVLTLHTASLQDSRMLTEFLESVELEESQEVRGEDYNSKDALYTNMSSASTLLDDACREVAAPLMKTIVDPIGELREAVEMLNDTVRERGRAQSHIHDKDIQNLIRQLAVLSVRVEDHLCCSIKLTLELVQIESDMALRCEPESCGLGSLDEQQHHLEVDYAKLTVEIEELQKQMCHLVELCPERVSILGVKVQETMRMWWDLGKNMDENRHRLQQCVALQEFFRNYLSIMLWTEETHEFILSERVFHCGRDQEHLAAELDMDNQINKKFEEFVQLDATGRMLLDTEHHLANMQIQECLDESRSMLDWILINWRAQKHRRNLGKQNTENTTEIIYSEHPREPTVDPIYSNMTDDHTTEKNTYTHKAKLLSGGPVENIYSEASAGSPLRNPSHSESHQPTAGTVSEKQPTATDLNNDYQVMTSDGYELMNNVHGQAERSSDLIGPQTIKDLGKHGDSHVEVKEEQTSEPVHRPTKSFWKRCQGLLENTLGSLRRKRSRYVQSTDQVSTYLHVKENKMAASAPVYEGITLPRLHDKTLQSSAFSSGPPCFVSSFSPPTSSSTPLSIFSTLKKRKSKRDPGQHTIQRTMGVVVEELTERACPNQTSTQPITSYNTQTWPMKNAFRKKKSQSNAEEVRPGTRVEFKDYVQNPLAKDIIDECSGVFTISPYAVTKASAIAPPRGPMRSH